jgi:hypothetical protein
LNPDTGTYITLFKALDVMEKKNFTVPTETHICCLYFFSFFSFLFFSDDQIKKDEWMGHVTNKGEEE